MGTHDDRQLLTDFESDYSTLLDQMPRPVMLIDLEGTIKYWNPAGQDVTGYGAAKVLEKKIWQLFSGYEQSDFKSDLKTLEKGCTVSRETRLECPGDKILWMDLKHRLVELKEGQKYVLSSASDISDLVATEKEFALSEARMQAILNTAVEAIITIDKYGMIQSFNQAAEKMFGYRAQEVVGESVNILMPAPYNEHHDEYMQHYLDTGEKKIIGIGREVRGKRKNGEVFPMELAVSELRFKGDIIFTGLAKDISDRRRLENEILQISEEERQKIGRDLHDGLGQMLTGIGLIAQNLARRLKEKDLEGAQEVQEIYEMLKEADEQARTLSHGLVHTELEEEGPKVVLEQLCKRSQRLFNVKCRCRVDPSLNIQDKMVTLHLYRIVQEAIRNAVKHGKATRVDVTLRRNGDYIQLAVEDNGIGFNQNHDTPKLKGIGINTMKYRAHLLGGYLHFDESPEGNTMVDCRIPVQDFINPQN